MIFPFTTPLRRFGTLPRCVRLRYREPVLLDGSGVSCRTDETRVLVNTPVLPSAAKRTKNVYTDVTLVNRRASASPYRCTTAALTRTLLSALNVAMAVFFF